MRNSFLVYSKSNVKGHVMNYFSSLFLERSPSNITLWRIPSAG